MITAIAALDGELSGLRRHMEMAGSFDAGGALVEEGRLSGQDCLLVRSGMGRQRAEKATHYVLQRYKPDAILSLGYCGALEATLRVGDLVVCSPLTALLIMPATPVPATPEGVIHCDHSLVQQALHVNLPPVRELPFQSRHSGMQPVVGGGCLTVPGVAIDPRLKEWLSSSFASAVVDMESFWIGTLAEQAGVPFLTVRSVSDSQAESLPPLDDLVDDYGRVRMKAMGRYLVSHPWGVGQLARLGLQAQRAQNSLTSFTVKFLREFTR